MTRKTQRSASDPEQEGSISSLTGMGHNRVNRVIYWIMNLLSKNQGGEMWKTKKSQVKNERDEYLDSC